MMFDPAQLVLGVTAHEPQLTLHSFHDGPGTAVALAEIQNAAHWDGLPRVLCAPEGAGKTHLAHIFARATDAIMLRANRLSAGSVPGAADAPAVVLEDGHDLSGGPLREEIAFHLFNQARDLKQPLLITGRGLVRDWGLRLPDLSSRLTAAAQIRVNAPDETTLLMVLIKLFADRQLAVPLETVEYAVHRMERSYATASRLVAALDEENLRGNRRITKPMIRDILSDL